MAVSRGVIAPDRLQTALGEVARVSALVASYCDRTEHNEVSSAESLRAAAKRLRAVAALLADELHVDLTHAYPDRVAQVERLSPLEPLLPSPADELRRARSWRDVQVAQLRHDRHFHPDVFGLPKRDQLIHVALHLTKLTGALAVLTDAEPGSLIEFSQRRLPDLMLFAIKLSTLAGEHLPDEPVLTRFEAPDES